MTQRSLTPLVAGLGFTAIAAILLWQPRATTVERATFDGDALIETLGRMERSQAALTGAVAALAERVDTPRLEPIAGAARTEARRGDDPSLASLVASLDALREALETETRRTHELIRGSPVFGGESLREARRRNTTTHWGSLDALGEDWRADRAAADRSQYFQTAQDLLEAYGPPSAIYRPKGGLLFVYRRHAEGAAGPAWYFRLQDGFVVEFWVEDEVEETD